MSRITKSEVDEIVDESIPLVRQLGITVEQIETGKVTARLKFSQGLLRPGGTVSGPAQMGFADFVMYVVVLSHIGRKAGEGAATTSLNINFLRLPGKADVIAEAHALKIGKRLAVVEVTLFSEGDHEPVAHVTGTYSIPPAPRPSSRYGSERP
jgi:uncharacterized protein (TIGR00369 family)